jgi:hypothetical protein
MMLRWFRFSALGVEDQYGYGTESEAAEYVRLIGPKYSEVPSNAVFPTTVDATAFSLRKALSAPREEWYVLPSQPPPRRNSGQ